MPYTYILQSVSHGTYYIGSTLELSQRLYRHNQGWVRSTKGKKPWRLIYSEAFHTLSEARQREKQMKAWKDRSAIERLINESRYGPIV